MEKPENPEFFTQFSVEDLTIYIEKNAMNDMKDDGQITFKVHNYGEFVIKI